MADLLSDIAFNLTLDPDELKVEREVILQEIAGVEDTPDDLAFVLWQEDFWPAHPLGQPVLGRADTVGCFQPADFCAYMNQHHRADRVLVAAVGGMEHDKLLELLSPELEKLLPSATAPQRQAPVSSPGLRIVSKDTEQEHLVLGVPGLNTSHPARLKLSLLNLILGGNMSSRLFQEVRERRGLAYSVYSFVNLQEDSGAWCIYLGVPVKRTAEALRVIDEQLAKLQEHSVAEDELNDAKQCLKAGILLAAENMESRVSHLARNEFTFGRDIPIKEILARLAKIEAEELRWLACRLWDEKYRRLLALGPADEKNIIWK
jgi:predicted Zn-dependent peptidase